MVMVGDGYISFPQMPFHMFAQLFGSSYKTRYWKRIHTTREPLQYRKRRRFFQACVLPSIHRNHKLTILLPLPPKNSTSFLALHASFFATGCTIPWRTIATASWESGRSAGAPMTATLTASYRDAEHQDKLQTVKKRFSDGTPDQSRKLKKAASPLALHLQLITNMLHLP